MSIAEVSPLSWVGNRASKDNDLTYRLRCYAVKPRVFLWLMNRKVTLSGLPADVEYVRSWHDPVPDVFYVVFRSSEFEQTYEGYPLPPSSSFTVTEYHDIPTGEVQP